MTGPVERFARQIAGHGYIVAAPSSYEALTYDDEGTNKGNEWKITKVREEQSMSLYSWPANTIDPLDYRLCNPTIRTPPRPWTTS